MTARIRLLIIANHPTVLADMLTIFQLADDFEVIGEATSLGEAIHLSQALHPDVALVDMEMTGKESRGGTVISQMKAKHLAKAVAALTSHDYPAARKDVFHCGADAIIIKGADFNSVLEELRQIVEV
ncbi:MAG: response regulator transcription factor [Anaerolineaceae bacterium]|nr:response regulator transcription factor [Anaerolineaceae bacterium]